MNYIKQLSALLLIIFAPACGNTEEESVTTPLTTTPADTTTTIQPVQQPTAPVTNSVALNPAHGMPGHRCDIKVGDPLNSKPVPATTNTQQPSIMTPAPAQTTAGNGAKNPAHGMPGHRCDIAVGAPLNSKPTQ